MPPKRNHVLSRREFMWLSAASAAGTALATPGALGLDVIPPPMKRRFGRMGFDVTTLGLGGQASIQWTPPDVDPVRIITKAVGLGVNYFDTSNAYGPSQLNFHKAWAALNLIPGRPGYDKARRASIFLTTKTMVRWAKGGYPHQPNIRNFTQGAPGSGAVDDLKRSLSQMFGNDDGTYPDGAYVDMILIHNLGNTDEVDVLYQGLDTPLERRENFGALVALRDFRDGTNLTGLNPNHEKLVRHLGFSGHYNAPAMIEMIQRDTQGLLDGMLVSINVNDRRYLNMQYNVIPVAQARNMGIIAMKVFADGAMYTKDARWSRTPEDVVRLVGTPEMPCRPLIEYVLTTPGVHTLIIGIGEINDDPLRCQLVQDYYAAQIAPDALTESQRRELEALGARAKDGQTNWFQMASQGLTPPRHAHIERAKDAIVLTWSAGYAGDEPLAHYEILRDGALIDTVKHAPQVSKTPFRHEVDAAEGGAFTIVTVDAAGRKAASQPLIV
jgi:aryl-alcohol dehydrogenase-like predicted oxidoreductase